MDNAQMDALTDVTHNIWIVRILLGFHAGNLQCFSPHDYQGFSMGYQQVVMR